MVGEIKSRQAYYPGLKRSVRYNRGRANRNAGSDKIKIFVFVRNNLLKKGIEHALSFQGDFETLRYTDITEVLSATHIMAPDVAVVDADLPGEEGLNVMRQIKKHLPGAGIIALTLEHDNNDMMLRILKAQADACLSKGITAEKLADTIYSVARGEHPIHMTLIANPALADQVFRQFQDLTRVNEMRTVVTQLTVRELEILSHVADGCMNKQIAIKLGISEQTIKNHVTSILRKLNASARTEAVEVARKQGLLPAVVNTNS